MIEVLHHFISFGGVDLSYLFSGFLLGIGTIFLPQLRLPFLLTKFMIEVIHWWLKTHPKGRQISRETNFDNEFHALFGKYIDKYEAKVDNE